MQNRFRNFWLVLSFLIACSALVASAQIGDEDQCREACRVAKDRCVDQCGEHSNPMECESNCQEARDDCERGCF
jgi:hypothetical protein